MARYIKLIGGSKVTFHTDEILYEFELGFTVKGGCCRYLNVKSFSQRAEVPSTYIVKLSGKNNVRCLPVSYSAGGSLRVPLLLYQLQAMSGKRRA